MKQNYNKEKIEMVKIDNFYFVVENIEKSVEFYTALLNQKPANIIKDRWADWENNQGQIYFGIISKKSADCKLIKGNNAVLGLYTENLEEAYELCKKLGAKILYKPEEIPNSKDHYKCFAIEDLDGNKIEIATYDK